MRMNTDLSCPAEILTSATATSGTKLLEVAIFQTTAVDAGLASGV